MTIGDVYQNGKPVGDLLFLKDVVKGKGASRLVPVNRDGQAAIGELIFWHHQRYDNLSADRPLFPSRKGSGAIAMTRKTAHLVLKDAFVRAGLNGKLATHSLRKSFAQRVFDATGNIYLVQELLGHTSIETTKKYLGISYQLMQEAVSEIEISQCNRPEISLHSHTPFEKTTTDIFRLQRELERKDQIIDRLLELTELKVDEPAEQVAQGGKVIMMDTLRRRNLRR